MPFFNRNGKKIQTPFDPEGIAALLCLGCDVRADEGTPLDQVEKDLVLIKRRPPVCGSEKRSKGVIRIRVKSYFPELDFQNN